MILSEEGKYLFDITNNIEYTDEDHNEIKKKLFGESGYTESSGSIIVNKNGIEFEFSSYFDCIKVKSNLNQEGIFLAKYPLKLSIILQNKKREEIDVYTEEQFDKILENRKIEYPVTDSMVLTDQLKKVIFDNNYNIKLEIMDISLSKTFDEEKEKNDVFEKLSKYIHLYMKSKFDIKDFPENEFFKEEDFIIKKNQKMKFYYKETDIRALLITKLQKVIKNGDFYCMTGPHGVGKTFTLLGFLSQQKKEGFYYIYINLDVLDKEKNKMEILFYEAKNLFETKEQYISAFKYVKENLKIFSLTYPTINFLENLEDAILPTVICLIEYIDNKIENKNNIYTIVIDQFKYRNDTDYDSELILELKSKILQKKNFSLIVCSSLNYSGIKDNLISKVSKRIQGCNFLFELLNRLLDKPDIGKENEYLYLFGYLPRYCNIQNIINKKYVNLNKKIIKRKLIKFYTHELEQNKQNYKVEDYIKSKLKWIIENKKSQLTRDKMLDFMKTNPIKYFTLDLKKLSFDFLFPLIEIVVNEIVKSEELKNSIYGFYNEAEKGWYFEHSLFDRMKNTNKFLNYYIEDTIVIKTIFKKEILKNFNEKANTLFCFSISNVKRYDGVLYIADKEYALLIQASIHKPKKKLDEYTIENMKEDTLKMEKKFFRPNGISIKKYYLIFVLDYEFYHDKIQNMKDLKKYPYNFSFYNPKKDEINYESIKDFELNEIGFDSSNQILETEKVDEDENSGIFFVRENNFEKIEENLVKDKPGYYYVEKGMDLITFMEEICIEYNNLIDYLNKNKSDYSRYKLIFLKESYYSFLLNEFSEKRIAIVLKDKNLYFGTSIIREKNRNYKWKKYSYKFCDDEEEAFEKNEENSIKDLSGFFVFEKH